MRFLRNAWYPVAQSSDVTAERPFSRTLLNEPLVFFRDGDGVVRVLLDRCPHRFAPLSTGQLIEGRVQCPYHGLQFDGRGNCAYNPHGDGTIPKAATVRAYPAQERNGLVWVWPGEEARSHEVPLPDLGDLHPADTGNTSLGYLLSNANFEIVIDNLTDLSHADFLHGALLSTRGAILRTVPAVENLSPRAVKISIALTADKYPAMPLFRPHMPRPDDPATTEMHITWHAPCIVDIVARVSQDGPEGPVQHATRGIQLLAPETETTTHYHVLGTRTMAPNNPAATAAILQATLAAFNNEDGPILRAVQQNLGGRPYHEMRPMLLSSDSGSIRVRRAYEALLSTAQ